MPTALMQGVPFETFWKLNPRLLKAYSQAYKLRMKDENMMMYLQGQYFMSALGATVGNMFKKKGAKMNEYVKEPFDIFADHTLVITEEMSDEQKKKNTEIFFKTLERMQRLHEKSKNKN